MNIFLCICLWSDIIKVCTKYLRIKKSKIESWPGFFYHPGHTGIFLLCEHLSSKTFWLTIINLTVINKQWWQAGTNHSEPPRAHDYKETLSVSMSRDFSRVPAYRNLNKTVQVNSKTLEINLHSTPGRRKLSEICVVIIHIKFEILLTICLNMMV